MITLEILGSMPCFKRFVARLNVWSDVPIASRVSRVVGRELCDPGLSRRKSCNLRALKYAEYLHIFSVSSKHCSEAYQFF